MQGSNWPDLFRRIPEQFLDGIALGLSNGTEIVMLQLQRLEDEFIIIRGRLAGTTDGLRVAVIPYSQLVTVGFLKPMTDPEIESIFGGAIPAAAVTRPVAPDLAEVPEMPEPNVAESIVNKAALPSKAILLAKLRARLGGNGANDK